MPRSESAPAAARLDAESLALARRLPPPPPPRRSIDPRPPPDASAPSPFPPPRGAPRLALAARLAGGEKPRVDVAGACQLAARNVRADDGVVHAPVNDAPSPSPSLPLPRAALRWMARPPGTDAAASDATDATLGVKLTRRVVVAAAASSSSSSRSSSSDHDGPGPGPAGRSASRSSGWPSRRFLRRRCWRRVSAAREL